MVQVPVTLVLTEPAHSRNCRYDLGLQPGLCPLLRRLRHQGPPPFPLDYVVAAVPPLPPRGAEHQPHDLGHVLVLAGPRRVLTQGPPSLLRDGGPLDEGQRPQAQVVALAEALGRYDPASGPE